MPKISALPVGGTLTGDELIPATQAGVTKSFTATQLTSLGGSDVVSPFNYGAIADGSAHPLSSVYGSLAAAQAVYPFVTALTQQIDYCACKAASNAAFGADGAENAATTWLNKRLELGTGRFYFGSDTWLIRNLASGIISGNGRLVTVLTGTGIVLQFDGIWYSELANFSLSGSSGSGVAALDIDGNVPGHPYTTRGVQGITLRNLGIDGTGLNYCMALCRQGGSSGQGSECLYLNCYFVGATIACYYQNGFNALANSFIGGNFQAYDKNGIYVTGGTVAVFNTGFQSTVGYDQITNDGWDINVGDAGVFDGVPIYGCRTESLRFLKNAGAVTTDVRGCTGRSALAGWAALTAYGLAQSAGPAIQKSGYLFKATTEGTSGSSEPTWLFDGTPVSDGSVVWNIETFNVVDITEFAGSFDYKSCFFSMGTVLAPGQTRVTWRDADYTVVDSSYDYVFVDATAGSVTITVAVNTYRRGRTITVKKVDDSTNDVSVVFESTPWEGSGTTDTLHVYGQSKTYVYSDGDGGARYWQPIAAHGIASGQTSGLGKFPDGWGNALQLAGNDPGLWWLDGTEGAILAYTSFTETLYLARTASLVATNYLDFDLGNAVLFPDINKSWSLGKAGNAFDALYLGTSLNLADGVTAPATTAGQAKIYVDSADGDLKVKFGDGTVKTIVVDT